MPNIKFVHDSYIKARPVQSGELLESEKEFVKTGAVYPIVAKSPAPERGHLKVTLGKDAAGKQITVDGRNTVYIYLGHVDQGEPTRTSPKGISLIKEFEGCELMAYPDPGTGGSPWTIGYGSTGPHVYPGLTIDQATAENWLKSDLQRFEQAVVELVTVSLNQNQFDALVSFSFNVGTGALETSTLLKLLNQKDYKGAADQFLRWDKAGGQVMPGLTRRREAERKLFLS